MSHLDLLGKIRSRRAVIVVMGLGYVGLPLAVEKAKAGFTVIGIERNPERVQKVNRRESYIPQKNWQRGDYLWQSIAAKTLTVYNRV